MLLDGMLVILSTLSTMTLSYMIGVQSQEYKPVIQPSNGAFSICLTKGIKMENLPPYI